MAHVFISYSRRDIAYVQRLVEALLERGFDVWFDAQISYGENWERAIFRAIDQAAAVIVVMSSSAAESAWVPREIAYAEDRKKPILPLLLEGEVFPRLILTQFEDVRAGDLPRDRYFSALAAISPPREGRGEQIQPQEGTPHGFARAPVSAADKTLPTDVRERQLESAMPRQSQRGVPSEVRVKISRVGAAGLRAELPDLTEYGDEIKKDDVRSSGFPLAFPLDVDGKALPVRACIQVESEQYRVQYPPNACGEGGAEVEIQPDHDTRTVIFSLIPRDSAYVGRAGVTVRLVRDGQVIAESRVATRVVEQVTEQVYTLAAAAAFGSKSAPGAVEKKKAESRLEGGAVDFEDEALPSDRARVVAGGTTEVEEAEALLDDLLPSERQDPPRPVTFAPAPMAPMPTKPVILPSASGDAPPQNAQKRMKRRFPLQQMGALVGILLAGIVGVLVLSTNSFSALPPNSVETQQIQTTAAFDQTQIAAVASMTPTVLLTGMVDETEMAAAISTMHWVSTRTAATLTAAALIPSDSDGDGVPDAQDRCPLQPPLGFQGEGDCPDTDADGVVDPFDACPTQFGLAGGCPDSDQDGVPDTLDQCQGIAAPGSQNGCPSDTNATSMMPTRVPSTPTASNTPEPSRTATLTLTPTPVRIMGQVRAGTTTEMSWGVLVFTGDPASMLLASGRLPSGTEVEVLGRAEYQDRSYYLVRAIIDVMQMPSTRSVWVSTLRVDLNGALSVDDVPLWTGETP